jgi:hypothetical protein
MFGGNGGLLGFTIGNPKYPKGLGGLSGLNPPSGSIGCLAKILSTSLGISICMFTRFVSLGVYGINLMPIMVWASVVVNGILITITIKWGITTKYNGIDLTGSTLKLEVPT